MTIPVQNFQAVDITPYIKTHPYDWEWLDRPAVDQYLATMGFETIAKLGDELKCTKDEWTVWLGCGGWQIGYLDPETDCCQNLFRYGQGLEDGLQVALNVIEGLQPHCFPSYDFLEKLYLEKKAVLSVDRMNRREFIYQGIHYFCRYSWGRSVRLFGEVGGWSVYDAEPSENFKVKKSL